MQVTTGTRLGPYEIVAPIGAGGMGEVFKARDTRLERSVAIKVLPAEFARDAQFRLRFEREAKSISALNHPNICTLYDVGHEDGTDYLVMELIDGDSLADRLAKGPLPLEQVLRYGVQIADALDKAHRQGIVHRDLKPGNIMITRSGAKLLDFGLAKPAEGGMLTRMSALTEQKPITEQGQILGTFQYMAPEQLEGVEADPRTDIFALGAVLYEMATGRRAFEGKTRTSLIAAIVSSEPPPLSQVQPLTPPALEHVIRKCLAKDRDDRWQSAHDIAAELRWISEIGSQAGVAAPVTRRRRRREAMAWTAAAVLLATTLALAYAVYSLSPRATARYTFDVTPQAGAHFDSVDGPVIVSPNGQQLAFLVRPGGIGVRTLSSAEVRMLPGTESAYDLFWSPDSRNIGFFQDGVLKRIDVNGGAARAVAQAGDSRGATWSKEGVILFASGPVSALMRVPASGGIATAVTRVDRTREVGHWRPIFLPDGKRFLYFSRGLRNGTSAVYAGSLDSKDAPKLVMPLDTAPVFAPPEHLLFTVDGALLAQKLDMSSLRPDGEPVALADRVNYSNIYGSLAASASPGGVLAYQHASGAAPANIVTYDRTGKELARHAGGRNIDMSPDGTRVAYQRGERGREESIWVLDLANGSSNRITFDGINSIGPVWSPDSSEIAYASIRDERSGIYRRAATGGAEVFVQPLTNEAEPIAWSPDGRLMLIETAGSDLHLLSLAEKSVRPFAVSSAHSENSGRFSPDGRVIAYQSSESTPGQIYVQPVTTGGAKWQVSTSGGYSPRWGGKELFFVSKGMLMAAEVASTEPFQAAPPKELFRLDSPDFVVSPDGQKIHAAKSDDGERLPIRVVVNWNR